MNIKSYNQQTTANLVGNIAPASGVTISNPAANALGNVGQATDQIANQVGDANVFEKAYMSQQEKEANILAAANVTSQAQLDWTSKFQQAQQNATGYATDFTKSFLTDFDKYAQDTVSAYKDPTSQKLLQHEFTQMRTSFGMQGLNFQQKMFDNQKVQNLNGIAENNAAMILQDPSQLNKLTAQTHAVARNSGLDAIEQQKFIDSSDKSFQYAAVNHILTNDPQSGLEALKGVTGSYPEGSVQDRISKASGSNAAYNLAVMKMESSLDPNNKSTESSAAGLSGFIDTTRAQYGLPKDATLEQEVQALNALTNDNRKALTNSLGRKPTDAELYIAHHFGATGAKRLLSADPNTPIQNAVSPEAMKQNPYLRGKTVGQVIDLNSKKFVSHEVINSLPAEERVQYMPRFQSAVDTVSQVQAVNLQSTMQNQIAMASQGNISFQPLTQEQVNLAYPKDPQKAQDVFKSYSSAIEVGQAVNKINTLSPADEQAVLASHTPKDPNNYANELKSYDTIQKAIALKRTALASDSVSWAKTNSPTVSAAFNKIGTLSDPSLKASAQANAYDTLIAEQQRQGIQYPQILSKAELSQSLTQIQNTKGVQKSQLLTQLRDQYGTHWSTVAGQLQSSKDMPDGVAAIMSSPTPAARERAANLADVSIEQLKAVLPSDRKSTNIDGYVKQQLDSFNTSFPTYALAGKNLQDVTANVTKAAYSNAQTMSEKTSAKAAVDQFINAKYNFIDNYGEDKFKVRVPKEFNVGIIENNLTHQIKNLSVEDVDTSNAKLLRSSWTLKDDISGFLSQIKDKGYWMTNNNETGASLYFIGNNNIPYPVLNKQGKQISKTFQELNTEGK